jgi:hypothetical protein
MGCGATHVLLPLVALLRRADAAAVIGTALALKAAGLGHRRIALRLGRPAATVRGWLCRFAGRTDGIRSLFTTLALVVDADPPPIEPVGAFADAVAAWVPRSRRWPAAGRELVVRRRPMEPCLGGPESATVGDHRIDRARGEQWL